jgi:hypothetical protein
MIHNLVDKHIGFVELNAAVLEVRHNFNQLISPSRLQISNLALRSSPHF